MAAVHTVGVAIPVPQPWGSFIDRCRAAAGDPQADVIPAHLTLLGPTEVPEGRMPAVEAHLAAVAAAHRPFPLHLRGTGTFRPVTDVVFIAVVAGISECERLERAIRSGPLRRNLRFPYHPHVTVAHDMDAERLDAAFDGLAGFEAKFEATVFTLFEHGPDGRWRPRHDFELA